MFDIEWGLTISWSLDLWANSCKIQIVVFEVESAAAMIKSRAKELISSSVKPTSLWKEN